VISPETEVLCSGIKALNTWHVERVVSVCRERCGGQGACGFFWAAPAP
jgi:hypothetical protein